MYEYKLIRSKRKSISIQIDDNCQVVVRAPMKISKDEIDKMVLGQTDWIDKHMPRARERMEQSMRYTPELLNELSQKAKEILPSKVAYYSSLMGVEPTGIKISDSLCRRHQAFLADFITCLSLGLSGVAFIRFFSRVCFTLSENSY